MVDCSCTFHSCRSYCMAACFCTFHSCWSYCICTRTYGCLLLCCDFECMNVMYVCSSPYWTVKGWWVGRTKVLWKHLYRVIRVGGVCNALSNPSGHLGVAGWRGILCFSFFNSQIIHHSSLDTNTDNATQDLLTVNWVTLLRNLKLGYGKTRLLL